MAKKNQDDLIEIEAAITKIKNIKGNDSGDNLKFTEALAMAERNLLEQLFGIVSNNINKSKG